MNDTYDYGEVFNAIRIGSAIRRMIIARAAGKVVVCPSCRNLHYVAYCKTCSGAGYIAESLPATSRPDNDSSQGD